MQQAASTTLLDRFRGFSKPSLAEICVACIGCALIVAACLANQAWFDRHFMPSFWTPREDIIEIEQRVRVCVGIAGAVLILFLRKPIARAVRGEPLLIFMIGVAIALGIGTAEAVLRVRAAHKSPELGERLGHYDSYIGCFINQSYTKHEMHLGRHTELTFDRNGYRVADAATVVNFNAPTIVLTGESVIVGLKLNWQETIAAHLSDSLHLQSANVAIPGLGTDQAYLRLARELPRFRHPVAVVSLFTPSLFDRNLNDDRPHLGPGLRWLPPVKHWVLASMIERWIQYRSDAEVERGIAVTREVLTATVRLARSRGAVPLIVVPEFGTETPREHELRERILDEAHLPYVLVTLDDPDDRIDNDGHPNADGASAIAEAIADAIRPALSQKTQ